MAISLFFIIIVVVEYKKNPTVKNQVIDKQPEEVFESFETQKLKFIRLNRLSEKAYIAEKDFLKIKAAFATGLFKDEQFCEVFRKFIEVMDNGTKKEQASFIEKYNKIDNFLMFMYQHGQALCRFGVDNNTYTKDTSINYKIVDDPSKPCIISKDFIKQDLYYPDEAEFSSFDCSTEINSDGSYTILRKVSSQNGYGITKTFIYKITIGFKGGNWVDNNNWVLIKIQSEEYN